MLVEVAGGFFTHSLALMADAGHMLTDVGALGLSLLAIRFAERPATPSKSYGYHRVEILAALINAVVLLFISAFILFEAWQRFRRPSHVLSGPMVVVAAVGLIVNLAGVRLLGQASKGSLNVKAAYLEVLSDALASLGVIAAGILMLTTRWVWADPLVSAGIGLFILPRTWTLLDQAVHILMEGTPYDVDIASLEQAVKRVENVGAVHDLHIWAITSGYNALSAHITVNDPAATASWPTLNPSL